MKRVSDYLFRKASINRIPLSGSFELSPVCNFACKMCYVRKTPAQIRDEGKQIKHWSEWLELAKQCREAGMLYLLLTGGEPFLYPEFEKLYRSLHEMGFVLSINTNGTMIDEKTIEWLKKAAPSRVNITLYGASPETYQRICGNVAGYEKAVSAILGLKEAGIPVVINASMIPENAEDIEKIAAFGKEHGLNTRISTYMFPPVRRERQEDDSRFSAEAAADMYMRKIKCQQPPEIYQQELKQLLETAGKENEKENEEHWGVAEEYMKCRAGRSSFWISWDGTMSACGITPFPVVKYPFEEPFLDCWKELTGKVRTTPVLKGCAGCEKKEICNPCVAMIYAETGGVNCRSSYMCELADHIVQRIEREVKEGIDDGQSDEK